MGAGFVFLMDQIRLALEKDKDEKGRRRLLFRRAVED